jgi:ureidoglycolate lyase
MAPVNAVDPPHLAPLPLQVQALTRHAFAPFGEVLEKTEGSHETINYGHTLKFADLARIDVRAESGRIAVHIYHSLPVTLPLRIEFLERHTLGSQAFMPLQQKPFLVVVAPASAAPKASDVQAFFSNGQQGVNIHKGVWHHYQITFGQPADYLVIDRAGPGENFEEHRLTQSLELASLPW